MRDYMRPNNFLWDPEERNRANASLGPLDILNEHFRSRAENGYTTFEQLLASQVHWA